MPSPSPPPRSRPFAYLPILLSGLFALVVAQAAWHNPRFLLAFALVPALMPLPALLARRRMRRVLVSGDVQRVLGSWAGSIDRIMYPETMGPLMAATAYASYGWVDASRNALARAVKGPAWDAALEQRLFVESLLDTFEGDRATAVQKAESLEQMPILAAGFLARRRIKLLRRGVLAFARAFAHSSVTADANVLRRAANASPLVHWAMRYAAAIVALDHGHPREVTALLQGAPAWPAESAFRGYHDELVARVVG